MLARSLLASLLLVPMVGCIGSPSDDSQPQAGGGGGKADGASESLEDHLASLTNTPLTYEAVDGVLSLVAAGGTTTEHMSEARAFFDSRTDPNASWDDEQTQAIEYGQTALNIFYISMPRDIHVTGTSAVTFDEETTAYNPDDGYGYAVPFYLTVSGTTRLAYTLEFTIADSVLSIDVPAGSGTSNTARLIASKIYDSNEEILSNANSETFNTDAGEFPGLDDIGTDTDGATVSIEPSING